MNAREANISNAERGRKSKFSGTMGKTSSIRYIVPFINA